MITLIDGRQVDESGITFDPDTQHFTLGSQDITNVMFRRDKTNYSGFDMTKDNERIYQEKYAASHGGQAAPTVGSTSTLANFVQQIVTDPLGAPLESLDNEVAKIKSSSGIKTITTIAALALVAYIYFKVIKK